jgi:acetyl esterase/lipase
MHAENHIRPVFLGAVLVWVLCAVSCRAPVRELPTAAAFETWFTGTGADVPSCLQQATMTALDSLRGAVRRTGRSGAGSVVLTDTFGTPYTTGFYIPPSLRGDSAYPCIVYLHGGTGAVRNDKGELAWEMLRMLTDSMNLILASPSANRTAPWWSPAGLSRILQTLRYMSLHYPINPDKVFLAGVSDGATGCYAAANTIAAPFAGFIAISGFGGMLPQLGIQLHPENLMQRPIYNVNAGRDHLYPVVIVNKFLDRLAQDGVGIKRMVYPEEAHGFDYRDRECGTLCSLIRAWSLPEAGTVNWIASRRLPCNIRGIAAAEPVGSSGFFSVQEYCRNDTIFLRTSGLGGLQMYFEGGGECVESGLFSINSTMIRRLRCSTPEMKTELQIMKQRCFPFRCNGVFFTISL